MPRCCRKRSRDASFDFYSKELSGVQQQRDRWKRAVGAVNGALGEAVGNIYVRTHYPAESERQMRELISNLRAAYYERISGNSWMDEATRKAALDKLAAFEPRIGHPVKYIDYSALKVVKGDAARQRDPGRRLPVEAPAQALPQAGRPHACGE